VRAETGQRYVGVVLRPEHPFAALGSRGKKPFESLAQCGEVGEGVVAALHGHAPFRWRAEPPPDFGSCMQCCTAALTKPYQSGFGLGPDGRCRSTREDFSLLG
jgi:hypothetical protein